MKDSLRVSGVLTAAILGAPAPVAPKAAFPVFGHYDVKTVFFIDKSDDKNRVDYGLRLDANCRPSKDALFPYWREFEKAPPVRTHDLNFIERTAYGIREQRELLRTESETRYQVVLKQFSRPITLHIRKVEGGCVAVPHMPIAGIAQAELMSVFLKLSGFMSVAYVDVHGRDPSNQQPIVERVKR